MKKWEKPQVNNLKIKKTEAIGIPCDDCTRTNNRATQIICWQCDCCKTIYHSNECDNPQQAAIDCENKHIANNDGKCS